MTTTQEAPTIGQMLQDKRGKGYKTDAARAIGVSRQVYPTWETGHAIPGDEWAKPLAAYLGLELAEVVLRLYNERAAKHDPDAQVDITWKSGQPVPVWVPRPIQAFATGARLRAA